MALRFKNVSPLGRLDVPYLRDEPVERGEVFDVSDELGEFFAAQPENFEAVSDEEGDD